LKAPELERGRSSCRRASAAGSFFRRFGGYLAQKHAATAVPRPVRQLLSDPWEMQ
jgi:hypothetical protein